MKIILASILVVQAASFGAVSFGQKVKLPIAPSHAGPWQPNGGIFGNIFNNPDITPTPPMMDKPFKPKTTFVVWYDPETGKLKFSYSGPDKLSPLPTDGSHPSPYFSHWREQLMTHFDQEMDYVPFSRDEFEELLEVYKPAGESRPCAEYGPAWDCLKGNKKFDEEFMGSIQAYEYLNGEFDDWDKVYPDGRQVYTECTEVAGGNLLKKNPCHLCNVNFSNIDPKILKGLRTLGSVAGPVGDMAEVAMIGGTIAAGDFDNASVMTAEFALGSGGSAALVYIPSIAAGGGFVLLISGAAVGVTAGVSIAVGKKVGEEVFIGGRQEDWLTSWMCTICGQEQTPVIGGRPSSNAPKRGRAGGRYRY